STASAPTSIAIPSTATAPPVPSQAASPPVRRAPKGSTPTKAAAQIAIVRVLISSGLIAWTTTVDKPTKSTPPTPPTTPTATESGTFVDAPTAIRASAVIAKPN